jgi:hypothetical protein
MRIMKNKCLHATKTSTALVSIAENNGEWNSGCFLGENGQIVDIYTIIFLDMRLNSQEWLISSVYTRFSKFLSAWVEHHPIICIFSSAKPFKKKSSVRCAFRDVVWIVCSSLTWQEDRILRLLSILVWFALFLWSFSIGGCQFDAFTIHFYC